MATYEESGVNIDLGDKCSRIAYQAAKNTFAGRRGMIGEPLTDEGGFAGALDMGDYYLVQNDDGIGTKMMIAEMIGKYDTMGYDLLAMVADDAICIGAETISVSNTIDVDKVEEEKITALMTGLEKAALEQKIVIPGGEIAELGDMVHGYVWNATAVGIVEKHKMITGENIKEGDKIIGLLSAGFRSNGFSLIRHILKSKFGDDWAFEKFSEEKNWADAVLTPSIIYSSAILDIHGRYKQDPQTEIKGLIHVTGGGIPGNMSRILKKTDFGANLDNLPTPHEAMQKLIEIGDVSPEEAYKTWNMGVGMILIADPKNVDQITDTLKQNKIDTQIIGEVTTGEITLNL